MKYKLKTLALLLVLLFTLVMSAASVSADWACISYNNQMVCLDW